MVREGGRQGRKGGRGGVCEVAGMHSGRLRWQSEMPKDIGKTSPEYCSRREIRALFLHKLDGSALAAIEGCGEREENYAANYKGVVERGTECKGEDEGRAICGEKNRGKEKM